MKKKKKSTTHNIIVVMVVLTIVVSIILVAVNFLTSQLDDAGQDVTSQREWVRITDEIQYMAESADLAVKYYGSDQRVGIYFVGREGYYQLQYKADAKKLYLCEGTYTSTANTDELKISEATYNTAGLQPYADNILSFVVSGADSDGYFPSGQIDAVLRVEIGGVMSSGNDFKVTIPQEAE